MLKNKIVVFLISLIAALIFWIFVVTTDAPNATRWINGVQVSINNSSQLEAKGLIITAMDTDTVRVEAEASRATLSKLSASNVFASIDVQYLSAPGEYDISYSIDYVGVNSGDIKTKSASVDKIHVTVNEIHTKNVEIQLQSTGHVPDGFLFTEADVTIEPQSVSLRGPDYEVDRVSTAVITYDVSNMTKGATVRQKPVFLDAEGQEVELSELTIVNESEIAVYVPIIAVKDIQMKVELEYGANLSAENVTVELEPASIRVSGDPDIIKYLDDTIVLGEIDLTKADDGEQFTFPFTLPSDVNNLTGSDKVVATVNYRGVSYHTYHVTNIDLVNIPEDQEIELITRIAYVRLRGSKEALDAIKDEDVHVFVDLKDNEQNGTFQIKGTVVHEGGASVTVVGDVELTIHVS